MSESMSGIILEYDTLGACFFLWISATSLIHELISFGFFSEFSIEWTLTLLPSLFFLRTS